MRPPETVFSPSYRLHATHPSRLALNPHCGLVHRHYLNETVADIALLPWLVSPGTGVTVTVSVP
jgi:hypothetical protein